MHKAKLPSENGGHSEKWSCRVLIKEKERISNSSKRKFNKFFTLRIFTSILLNCSIKINKIQIPPKIVFLSIYSTKKKKTIKHKKYEYSKLNHDQWLH